MRLSCAGGPQTFAAQHDLVARFPTLPITAKRDPPLALPVTMPCADGHVLHEYDHAHLSGKSWVG